jgi:hypothetical protein
MSVSGPWGQFRGIDQLRVKGASSLAAQRDAAETPPLYERLDHSGGFRLFPTMLAVLVYVLCGASQTSTLATNIHQELGCFQVGVRRPTCWPGLARNLREMTPSLSMLASGHEISYNWGEPAYPYVPEYRYSGSLCRNIMASDIDSDKQDHPGRSRKGQQGHWLRWVNQRSGQCRCEWRHDVCHEGSECTNYDLSKIKVFTFQNWAAGHM